MCFSAEASFTAAAILGVAGGMNAKNCRTVSLLPLAAIPLLFGIQQLSEGVLWYYLGNAYESSHIFYGAMYFFLMFAFLIWPIWIPFSLYCAEQPGWRKTLILLIMLSGIALSTINLFYALKHDIVVQVVNHSIQYIGEVPSQTFLYPFIVLAPCFFSSLKNMWVFGLLVTCAYILAAYFYTTTFVSVWCFFAAVVSVVIYKIVSDNQYRSITQTLN